MPVLSSYEFLEAEEDFYDAPRATCESSSIFSTIEREIPSNLPTNEDMELPTGLTISNTPTRADGLLRQRKTIKEQIVSLKDTIIRKVKWFYSRDGPVVEDASDMATELLISMEQIATLDFQTGILQCASPPVSVFSPSNSAPDSPLDSEIPVPTWYAAHVPMHHQHYVAEGTVGQGSSELDQGLHAELFENIPRIVSMMPQQEGTSALSELNAFDRLAMTTTSFGTSATESDIQSALSFSTDGSNLDDSSNGDSELALSVSKTTTETAVGDSDLSTLGDDSSSLDGSFSIDSEFNEALLSLNQIESSRLSRESVDIAVHDAASFSNGLSTIGSGPEIFAANVNLAPEVEGPLQAMQDEPRVHVTLENHVQAFSLPDDIVVPDAGMHPREFGSGSANRCPPFNNFAPESNDFAKVSPCPLNLQVLPSFCRRSSFPDILASEDCSLPECAHMPDHASIGSANVLQPDDESLALANLGDLIAEIEEIIQETLGSTNRSFYENPTSSKRESWLCNFLDFDRRRSILRATGCYENENSGEDEFLEDYDTYEDFDRTDETERLIERCNQNLTLSRRWGTTELHLERIEKDTWLSEISKNPNTSDLYNHEETLTRAVVYSRTEKLSDQPLPLDFARTLFERNTPIMDFETELENLSVENQLRINSSEETEKLEKIVHRYRQIFRSLIRNMVWPCGDRLRKGLENILYVRFMEAEVVAEAARINQEISATRLKFAESPATFRAYLQTRLERCSLAFRRMENESKKCHDEMVQLEAGFNSNVGGFISDIKRIAAIRTHALDHYDHFAELNQGQDDFDEDYIHEWACVAEYRRITLWYQNINTARFQNLLAKNVGTLKKTGDFILEMLVMTHENIQDARRELSMCELREKGSPASEQ
ncbi:hypothetical protein METSCH_E03680 [Metschnikowia aff. pulcherrima]|uniref:Uncharacterized protein n=1 Tax=Metschnikowia aff. pulcherrima TaxID=2163413 RepID=A0A4P6XV66_9ASCO|nr:hypothetical protein METSCH_E03680 [Metschnikowia aff. pulcherrima]